MITKGIATSPVSMIERHAAGNSEKKLMLKSTAFVARFTGTAK
jgi:hypothetical protein